MIIKDTRAPINGEAMPMPVKGIMQDIKRLRAKFKRPHPWRARFFNVMAKKEKEI